MVTRSAYGNIAYMTSDNPMGPFTYQGESLRIRARISVLAATITRWFNLATSGMTYHANGGSELMNGNLDAWLPEILISIRITVNEDGSLPILQMTYEGLQKNLTRIKRPSFHHCMGFRIQNAYDWILVRGRYDYTRRSEAQQYTGGE